MASTADEPEQPLDRTGEAPSVDPSITPSAHRHSGPDVFAGHKRRIGGRRRSDNPHVQRRPTHRKNSTGPRRRELLQALGIFQRATPDQLWKLTRPDNQHDKLVRDTLLDLQDHRLVRVELGAVLPEVAAVLELDESRPGPDLGETWEVFTLLEWSGATEPRR